MSCHRTWRWTSSSGPHPARTPCRSTRPSRGDERRDRAIDELKQDHVRSVLIAVVRAYQLFLGPLLPSVVQVFTDVLGVCHRSARETWCVERAGVGSSPHWTVSSVPCRRIRSCSLIIQGHMDRRTVSGARSRCGGHTTHAQAFSAASSRSRTRRHERLVDSRRASERYTAAQHHCDDSTSDATRHAV